MSFFFRHLTLMFVLLRGLSADTVVSLKCNRTVEVTYGENLTLSCDIEWKEDDCQKNIYSIEWNDTTENLCEKNRCDFNKTSASLQMFNVIEEKNIKVGLSAHRGSDLVSISLKIKPVVVEVEDEDETKIRTSQPYSVDPVHHTNASKTVASVREKVIPISLAAVSAVIIAVVGVALYRHSRKQHQRALLKEQV